MILSVCEKGTCQSDKLMNSLLKNLFVFTGSLNIIAELYTDNLKLKMTNLEQCSYNFGNIGYEIGRVFRVLFNYDDKKVIDRANFY